MSHLRLYAPENPDSTAADWAARELLRPLGERTGDRGLEPWSRAWFEEIEHKRYARAGAWLPRILEFSRHRDESLLMIGHGLGSDALQYLRHGTDVTFAARTGDPTEHLRRNFEHRGLVPNVVPVLAGSPWPFANGQFDLAYFNGLDRRANGLTDSLAEIVRVLKAGGKLIALVPARHDVDYWQRWLLPHRRLFVSGPTPASETSLSSRELESLLAGFDSRLIQKRHLRRSELPPAWKFLPTSWLERVAGRVLVVRALKPVRSALPVAGSATSSAA